MSLLTIETIFDNKSSLKQTIQEAAVLGRFEIAVLKSTSSRYTVKCSQEGCGWRLHASKIDRNAPNFMIRTFNDQHTCMPICHLGNRQASAEWLAEKILAKLTDTPSYRPTEIQRDMQREHGVTVSYLKAWRAKEKANEQRLGSVEKGYTLLRNYCNQILKTNPGSTALVESDSQGRFFRMFIAYFASVCGFAYCRPLIGIDGTHLKAKYRGILLAATAIDAAGQLFPLAFAVVNAENDDNWRWFLSKLREILELPNENLRTITFLSDRQKGLVDGVDSVFPGAYHGFCMRHLSENFRKTFKNPLLVSRLWAAARASTVSKYNEEMAKMREIDTKTEAWFDDTTAPIFWSDAHFSGHRYGHYTSNIAEALNSWILEARQQPVLQMMETIRKQLMAWFVERRENGLKQNGLLVKDIQMQVDQAAMQARRYRIFPANNDEFECHSEKSQYVIKISTKECSCKRWQQRGLPCAHAASVILFLHRNPQLFAEHYFTLNNYRSCYAETIYPIPAKEQWNTSGEDEPAESNLQPPQTHRPPGRPKKRRIRTEDTEQKKRAFKCSRCKGIGHSRRTCKEVLE